MAVVEQTSLEQSCLDMAQKAHRAQQAMGLLRGETKNSWLLTAAGLLREHKADLLAANERDAARAAEMGLTPAMIDRLRLSHKLIESMAKGLEDVAGLPEPIGEVMEASIRPNGLEVRKVRVPLGVIFFIYESRPNVTADAAAIAIKSGNAVILRGGKEAAESNRAITTLLVEASRQTGVPEDAIQLVDTTDRAAVGHFLALDKYIAVAIPRGGEGLIRRVVAEAKMPVMKHFAGNCHIYIDRSADVDMAEAITINAKCQRMGVCNAAESLVVHSEIAPRFLPRVCRSLAERGVEVRGDMRCRHYVATATPASEADYYAEFLGPTISVKVVDSLDEAIGHINHYGSQHTDAIVTDDLAAAQQFTLAVDSSAVLVNASTRFNDGGEIGLGAEIGISTDKFHARGPCGIKELTSYKYVIYGQGQIRE